MTTPKAGAEDDDNSADTVHALPCRIRVEGGTKVSSVGLFTFSAGYRDDGLSASLRGRPLRGLELSVPAGYAGVVLKRTSCISHNLNQNACELTECRRMSSIHYWTHESPDHRLSQALAWTHTSLALHNQLPVAEE